MGTVRLKVDPDKDLFLKRDYFDNQFFSFGSFEVQGHKMDYLFHMESFQLPGQESRLLSHFAFLDETLGEYAEMTQVQDLEGIRIDPERFAIRLPDAEISGDMNKLHIYARMDYLTLDVDISPYRPVLPLSEDGVFPDKNLDLTGFSYPYCLTTGKLTLANSVMLVRGDSWYVRTWQRKLPRMLFAQKALSKMLEKKMTKEDGMMLRGMMCFVMSDYSVLDICFSYRDGKETSVGSLMYSNGNQVKLDIPPLAPAVLDFLAKVDDEPQTPLIFKMDFENPQLRVRTGIIPKRQEEIFKTLPDFHFFEGLTKMHGRNEKDKLTGYCYINIMGCP